MFRFQAEAYSKIKIDRVGCRTTNQPLVKDSVRTKTFGGFLVSMRVPRRHRRRFFHAIDRSNRQIENSENNVHTERAINGNRVFPAAFLITSAAVASDSKGGRGDSTNQVGRSRRV